MLYAFKRELHAELAKDILEVRQRELDYYTTNINNIGLNASLLSGFAFTTLTSHESRDVMQWIDEKSDDPFVVLDFALEPQQQMQVLLELFYLTSTISAMGSTLYTLYICLISTILGPGLALRGPEGSVDRAVLGLARVNRKVIQSFAFALNLFQFSILVNSFLNFHVIAAVVCMIFVIYYMFSITRNGNQLTREFVIDPSSIVTGQFEQEVVEGQEDDASMARREIDKAGDLFPTRMQNMRDSRTLKTGGRVSAADEYPHAHKPSTVAGNMMYRWQGPLLREDGPNMPPDAADGSGVRGRSLDEWFTNVFGGEAAKPAPVPNDEPPKPLEAIRRPLERGPYDDGSSYDSGSFYSDSQDGSSSASRSTHDGGRDGRAGRR